jgi:predicted nucleic-acid-binding protein
MKEEFNSLRKQFSVMKEEVVITSCKALVNNKIVSKEDINSILETIENITFRFDLKPSNELLF